LIVKIKQNYGLKWLEKTELFCSGINKGFSEFYKGQNYKNESSSISKTNSIKESDRPIVISNQSAQREN